MPSRVPASPARPKQGPFPPAACHRLPRYYEPLGLPLDSARFQLPPYAHGLRPTGAAETGLSCSTPFCRNVPPPLPRGAPTRSPDCNAGCAWPSPRHDRLGAPKHLSADILTRLARRSPYCGPLRRSLLRGSRRSARPRASRPRTGPCYSALRRLPRRDLHPWTTHHAANIRGSSRPAPRWSPKEPLTLYPPRPRRADPPGIPGTSPPLRRVARRRDVPPAGRASSDPRPGGLRRRADRAPGRRA